MKKIFYILVVVFIVIQFFRIDKTNPPTNKGMDFLTIKNTPTALASAIRSSCYDCHSNETQYPWYSNIQPIAWFLKSHIDDGRRHLNFSTFATYEPKKQAHKLNEAAEMVEIGEMPMESYLLMHSEAKLTEAQKKEFVDYFRKVEEEIRVANQLAPEPAKAEH